MMMIVFIDSLRFSADDSIFKHRIDGIPPLTDTVGFKEHWVIGNIIDFTFFS